MLTKELINEVLLEQGITTTAGAAGTSAINGASSDMANYEGIAAAISVGAIVSGAVTSVKWQQSSDNSNWDDLEGTSQPIADTDDNTTIYTAVHKPVDRYVRVVISRATQNATIGSVTYMKYGARTIPVTQTLTGEKFVSPAEGTA